MTYPPGPPSGPGFGGDPYGQGQGQPPQDPAWWGQPVQPAQPQPGWPGEQPAWQQPQAQPGWQQPVEQPGWQQQPGWGGQQGYLQQPGYPAGPPPQPPRRNTGLIVGIVLAVVAVLAIGVGAIVVVTRSDNSNNQAAATSTTTVAPTTTDTTTARPTTTTKSAPAGGKFTYSEYGQVWNFKLGDVALQADWVEGHDYNSCAPVEVKGKLTGLGCQYGSELVWKAENGAVMLTQFILTMSTPDKASAASGQFDDKDINLPAGSYISNWETGKWRDGSQSQFVVITFATATADVDVPTVEKYLKYRHSDTLAALVWR
ncbi:hypothetical protein [Nocardia sp. NBC_01327]|uniref:hypothetical protein n=1 Tax=Nocardia sp. NBC_01327 TaxID=2903593 RepID=UPI002E12584D|nr:hypothetical protein OG326_18665 [Nocardia sp. NBC_01327]